MQIFLYISNILCNFAPQNITAGTDSVKKSGDILKY